MTESEAIKSLTTIAEIIPGYCRSEAFSVAISALEKQIPKKLGKANFGNHKNFFDKCPNCGYEAAGSHFKYCHECGQRLDWGDNHDNHDNQV